MGVVSICGSGKEDRLDAGTTCVVYSDLLLDDMCAIQMLSTKYEHLILVAVNTEDLADSDYAPKGFSLDKALMSMSRWYKSVKVYTKSLSECGVDIGSKHLTAFLLCNATFIMQDNPECYKEIWAMGGMDDTGLNDEEEWNASQDYEAFCKLKALPNVHVITYDECVRLDNEYGARLKGVHHTLEYYDTYLQHMQLIRDSTACFDLQAVSVGLGLFD